MYSCEATCKKCGHMTIYTENEQWRIIGIANDLEVEIRTEGKHCNICGKVGPIKIVVRNEAISLLIFEKIISPTPPIGKSPIQSLQDAKDTIEDAWKNAFYPPDSSQPYQKPTMDNPCVMCSAKGTIEVKYKAHKKEGSFKGILTEECPVCDGKGYFK